jgi:DnaK suppressor protein
MTPEQRSKLEVKIKQEIIDTHTQIEQLEASIAPIEPDCSIGRLSRLEAMNTKSINEASLSNARARIRRLESVLDELDDPDYGICVLCDEPIAFGRLMLMPETNVCVACKEKGEV